MRGLAAALGFAVVAVITLALGIGANTPVFTIDNTVLLGEAPVFEADRLVRVSTSGSSGSPYGSASYPDFIAFRHSVTSFDNLVAYTTFASIFVVIQQRRGTLR